MFFPNLSLHPTFCLPLHQTTTTLFLCTLYIILHTINLPTCPHQCYNIYHWKMKTTKKYTLLDWLHVLNNEVLISVRHSPAPLAWTTLSGIRSRSKCAISSRSCMSCNRMGPRGPTVKELSLSDSGQPWPVVRRSHSYKRKLSL